MMFIRLIFFLVFITSLFSCHDANKTDSTAEKIMTVKAEPFSTTLFYTGTVQPLKTMVVTSPAEGVIQEAYFHYGDTVKANQVLFSLSSEKFLTDYKAALMAYLKAKNEFDTANNQLKESEFLRKNELISHDEFKTKKTGFYNAQLTFMQTKDTLVAMLRQLDIKKFKLDELSIQHIEKINQLIHADNDNQSLRILAPTAGMILLPMKEGSDSETKKTRKGDVIKQGEVLAVIGDVSGLTIHVNVNEFNINQLNVGQQVNVTGAAFPDFRLEGKISGIDHQAQSTMGGMPVFPVEIIVPTLTHAQQSIIHAGMSAKVEIHVESAPEITVPIDAVFFKNGVSHVKIRDPKTKKMQEIPVKTGQTTEDSVVILSSLKEGDQVVIAR